MNARRLALLTALLLTALPGATHGAAGEPSAGLAALAGERLVYRVRWGVLSVATAALEVEPGEGGTVVLRATARTLGWIDPVYPVRDLVESTVDIVTLLPLGFHKSTKEGHGKPQLVDVRFDPAARTATRVTAGVAGEPLALPASYQDPLSCIYAYRALAPGADGEVIFQVTDGKRLIAGAFREVGRERLRTRAGAFDAVIVEPAVEGLGGVFRQSRKAKLRIWFTDDARRRPLRFYTEVAVGSFSMELVRIEELSDP